MRTQSKFALVGWAGESHYRTELFSCLWTRKSLYLPTGRARTWKMNLLLLSTLSEASKSGMASQLPRKKIKNNNNNWPMWSPVVLRQVVAVETYARDTGKYDSAEDRENLNNHNRMERLKQITEHRNRYLLTTKKIFTTSWSTFLPEMLWRPQHLHPSASRRSTEPSVDRGFRVFWVLLHQITRKKKP